MLRSRKYRFIYFAPRKTGSTSIDDVLRKCFDDLEEVNMNRHEMILPKDCEHYVTFMSVRNPYSRFLSLYNFYYGKPSCPTIQEQAKVLGINEEWRYRSMYDEWHTPPHPWCVPIRIDYVVHLETLEKDFNQLPFVTRKMSMPRLTVSSKIESSLLPHIAKIVREFYDKDFEFFGYDRPRIHL